MTRSGSLYVTYSLLFGASVAHSMQVADSLCSNGYEPEGREFESLRAHHLFNKLGAPDFECPLPCP
jgi:hypothetical protein